MRHHPQADELAQISRHLALLEWEWGQLCAELQQRRYNPNQPREPAGTAIGGRWVSELGSGAPIPLFGSKPKQPEGERIQEANALAVPLVQWGLPLIAGAAVYAWKAGVDLYRSLSQSNAPGQQSVLTFNAKDFVPGKENSLALVEVGTLTQDQFQTYCPRLEDVQTRTDIIARQVREENPWMSPQQYGTRVHTELNRQIRGLSDPDYTSEVSILKGRADDEYYGKKGSIRVDVIEQSRPGIACVYDIKTGNTGLTGNRMAEIAGEVYHAYGLVKRVIVTEVRPRR